MTSVERRIGVRASKIVAVLALVAGTLAVLEPPAGAAAGPCRVRNTQTKQLYAGAGPNLQTAIDAALPGTILRVKGLCIGIFTIGKNLKLLGRSTTGYPIPILQGSGLGTVLTLSGASTSVTLRKLSVRGGLNSSFGGGIHNEGTLTIGASSVSNNGVAGGKGGGIYNAAGGTLIINDSTVSNNLAQGLGGGGGIYSDGTVKITSSILSGDATQSGGGAIRSTGDLTITDSTVSGNTAPFGGGIYLDFGGITLSGATSIDTNTAGYGGGIFNDAGTVTMMDAAEVRANTATGNGIDPGFGGGILDCHGALVGVVAGTNVFDNLPDNIAECV